jgi:DNA-binding transcriptional ArsR family regulator
MRASEFQWQAGPVTEVRADTEQRLEIRDPQVMRALAHPARLAIMEELQGGRTGTATELAQVCGLSPSATSYHLRALAKAGLVEEAPSRGDGRERVWQTQVRGFTIEPAPGASRDTRQAERELTDAFLDREEERVRRWLARSGDEPQEWYAASAISEGILLLTAEELNALNDAVLEMIRRYTRHRRPDPPPGARLVSALYRAFPIDDPLAPADVKH